MATIQEFLNELKGQSNNGTLTVKPLNSDKELEIAEIADVGPEGVVLSLKGGHSNTKRFFFYNAIESIGEKKKGNKPMHSF